MSEQSPQSLPPSDLKTVIRPLLDAAVERHRAGQLDEAERLYKRVLELEPGEANALTNLGTIFFQRGRIEEGVPLLKASLQAKPNQPNALNNLGHGLNMLGRFDEARAACLEAVALQPDNPDAWNNLGNARRELGDVEGALEAYERAFAAAPRMVAALGNKATLLRALNRGEEAMPVLERALAVDPLYVDAINELGNCLQELGRSQEALDAYARCLEIRPEHVEALSNSAVALSALKRHEEALGFCDRALALRPGYAEAWQNRGNALRFLKRIDEAIADFQRAIEFRPSLAEAHNNLGIALLEQKKPSEALAAFDEALALNRELGQAYANRANALRELGRRDEALTDYDTAIARGVDLRDVWNNRGVCLTEMHRFDEAIASFETANDIGTEYAEALWNKSVVLLTIGRDEEGWRLYEKRWKREDFNEKPNPFGKAPWLGDRDIAGKVLLIAAEQGIGDTLQMLRYIPLLADRGVRVVAAVQNPLVELARQVPGAWGVLGEGHSLPHWDAFIPAMSLPLAMGPTAEAIPQNVPYVFAPEEASVRWAARLGPRRRPRIGLVWSGSREHKNDHNRSIPLETFQSLLDLDAELISLQIEYRDADQPLVDGRFLDLKDEIKSFADTAAIMEQLDLVISVDTSVAHLAGAMGRPLWLLVPYTPDYRWRLDATDTPWYPSARLWRQDQRRTWAPVIEEVRAAAAAWLETAKTPS